MQKIKVRLPASLTDFGPSLRSLGLAISLYTQVEFTPRDDDQLIVETEGDAAEYYPLDLQHPVVLGMMRIFQQVEQALAGITVRVQNDIPLDSGFDVKTVFMAAGMVGANNMLGGVYNHREVIDLAAQICPRPDCAITSLIGGLTAYARHAHGITYRTLPLTPFKIVLAVPETTDFNPPPYPQHVPLRATVYNMQRLPLLLDALREGDFKLMAQMLDDKLMANALTQRINGFTQVAEAARNAGALAITTCGSGPALAFFAERDHASIARAVETTFAEMEIPARVMVLPLDTQGVVLSMMQTSL